VEWRWSTQEELQLVVDGVALALGIRDQDFLGDQISQPARERERERERERDRERES
jgi:hypothetical protein